MGQFSCLIKLSLSFNYYFIVENCIFSLLQQTWRKINSCIKQCEQLNREIILLLSFERDNGSTFNLHHNHTFFSTAFQRPFSLKCIEYGSSIRRKMIACFDCPMSLEEEKKVSASKFGSILVHSVQY